jgi:hypothetical protein
MALLAATTLGIDSADTVRAEVTSDADLVETQDYRLVVQSYDASVGAIPGHRARPVGSLQRAVTGAELRKGVSVSLLELRQAASVSAPLGSAAGEPVVVAWIEHGKPDLEFDGRMARPRPGSMYGVVRRSARQGRVQICLNRKLAA